MLCIEGFSNYNSTISGQQTAKIVRPQQYLVTKVNREYKHFFATSVDGNSSWLEKSGYLYLSVCHVFADQNSSASMSSSPTWMPLLVTSVNLKTTESEVVLSASLVSARNTMSIWFSRTKCLIRLWVMCQGEGRGIVDLNPSINPNFDEAMRLVDLASSN